MSQQFWTEFLQLYKENTCLWNTHSCMYMRRDLRNVSYNILLTKYREIDPMATLDMVKKKIDVFRTGFRREQRRINQHSPGYKPTLWYFDLLSFLNFNGEDQESSIPIIKECNESDDHNDNAEPGIEYIDIPNDYSTPNPVVKYRVKKRKLGSKVRRSNVAVTPPSPTFSSFEADEEEDCNTYCASLRLQMRELDTEQKFIAQKLISDVIFLARTSQLTLDSSINTQPF